MNKTEKANAKLMRSAGFKRGYEAGIGFVIWEYGDLRVGVGPRLMTIKRLVRCVIEQAAYRMRRNAYITFPGFAVDDKKTIIKGES